MIKIKYLIFKKGNLDDMNKIRYPFIFYSIFAIVQELSQIIWVVTHNNV